MKDKKTEKSHKILPGLSRIKTSYLAKTDWSLWLPCLFLSALSLLLLHAILQTGYTRILRIGNRSLLTQGASVVLGAAAAYILSRLNYRYIAEAWVIYVPAAYVLFLMTFIFGSATAGRPDAKRWLIVPIINMSIQPSEFLKIAFILAFAFHLSRVHETMNRPRHMALLFLHGMAPVLLIQLQGDSGSALLMGLTFLTMLFVSGMGWRYIAALSLFAGAMVPVLWRYVLSPWQQDRFLAFINQSSADLQNALWQQDQARQAIRAGGILGRGLYAPNPVYVPEMHNDFIFAFAVNALGFAGALAVIVAFCVLCVKLLLNLIAARDILARAICAGLLGMFFFGAMVNLGMCMTLLPVIGNPLPFLSVGGSSSLANYLGVGIALSVHAYGRKKKKTEEYLPVY